jgi:hypothetical protein
MSLSGFSKSINQSNQKKKKKEKTQSKRALASPVVVICRSGEPVLGEIGRSRHRSTKKVFSSAPEHTECAGPHKPDMDESINGSARSFIGHIGEQPTGQSVKTQPRPKLDRNLSAAKAVLIS